MTLHPYEQTFLEKYNYIIGIDEAGRGPWAGPVTVGGVLLNTESISRLISFSALNDSKKVSHKKRAILEKDLIESVIAFSISDVESETIDKINILEATKLGILNVLDSLTSLNDLHLTKVGILIDGKFSNIKEFILQLASFQNIEFDVLTVIDGDALCPSIAAASILAKEHRDKLMQKFHIKYPEYGFDKHKGYGTKLHTERLSIFGPCEIHRKSFAPIKTLLRKDLMI